MPAMAGDWPRDPRAYGSPPHPEPPAPVRTLPSVAELLSTRPSANTTIPAYHHRHDYFHARSTPPSASLAPVTASSTASPTASSYWSPVNHRQTSPPVSPTEQRPLLTDTTRVYHPPILRRQQLPKETPALPQPALSSGVHSASHSTLQARQDSAIDQHRFDTGNDAQLSKSNVSFPHQSPKASQRQSSPRLDSYQLASSAQSYAPPAAPLHGDTLSGQEGLHHPALYHSKSLSSGTPSSAASTKLHEHSIERTVPLDTRNGPDSRPNITGPSSLPEQFFTQQNNFGTRQQRYNVRFAANYTSENMPPSQKPRNEPSPPPIAPAVVVEPEKSTSPSVSVPTAEEPLTSASNGTTRHVDAQPPRPARDTTRDRGDREPSVERCLGCNEAWRRPIPDMGSENDRPAENNAEYMRLASNLIDRLRNERKKADAAYDDWKWRHSHCYRQPSPYSTGSVDDASKPSAVTPQADGTTNGNTTNKRKSEVPHEPHSASKQRRMASISPAPAVRKPD